MNEASDAQLMSRSQAGDQEAFAEIMDRYKDSLVNYLTHLCGSRANGEEVAQETFVRLYEHAANYREDGKLAPYLFKIATNLVRSERRKHRLREMLLLRFHSNGHPLSPPPDRQALQTEVQHVVSQALQALPLHYRAPLVLREIEGWSYDEIAHALNCPIGTVKSRIGRGREVLRHSLHPYWNGGKTS